MKSPETYGINVTAYSAESVDPNNLYKIGIEMPDNVIIWQHVKNVHEAFQGIDKFLKKTYGEEYCISSYSMKEYKK